MKTTNIITAFEDHNGILGWTIGLLDDTFDSDIDACDGSLLAHDLLEHDPKSDVKGFSNELQALGAVHSVRGAQFELNYDLLSMVYTMAYNEIIIPENQPLEVDYDFTCFVNEFCKSLRHEIDLEYLTTDERKNLKNAIKYAASHMQIGYDWAEGRYSRTNPSYLFEEIKNNCPEPEYIGQQYKVIIDENLLEVVFIELFEEELFEEELFEEEY